VQRKLGAGGMGAVYLARNKLMDRLEVLKVVNPNLLGHAGATDRFLQEIRAAARLQHPNVVTAYAGSRLGDLLVLAMEYVDGMDLDRLVKEKGPLPVAHACHYARQVALGLQHAHEEGLVHRDIKPSNLILGRNGVVKILDFGLAKVRCEEEGANSGLTSENVMMGTPAYMAPEQATDARGADIRADIYSLGCTLYFLLIRRPPFVECSYPAALLAHQQLRPKPVNELRPDVPAGLAAVVAQMLAKDPAVRYQTPGEVARELAPFIKGKVKPQQPQPRSRRPRGPAVSDKKQAVRQPGEIMTVSLPAGGTMSFAWIPPGTFQMGSDFDDSEKPIHLVTLTKGFYMGVYPVTQSQWQAVMSANPSHFRGDDRPVEMVSWDDCQKFCEILRQHTGKLICLPTEAEWEYACRAGTSTDFYTGNGEKALRKAGWFGGPTHLGNSDMQTHPVGKRAPNAWGLYDMHGNVWEWCQDWYGPYKGLRATDPLCTDKSKKKTRVIRGGAWSAVYFACRASNRLGIAPSDRDSSGGFRVVVRLD
jgi:formylglycine-generating enzyme required for sulfatase activity